MSTAARHTEGATPTRGRAFGALSSRRGLIGVVSAALLAALLFVHAFVAETFTVPSASMEPAYSPGDRILVDKLDRTAQRGQVIVFSGADVFYPSSARGGVLGALDSVAGWVGFRPDESDYLKRVIGIGGDHVIVDHVGRLLVNGKIVREPYLPKGQRRASAQPFDLRVPAGKLFVLGDNRDDSDDSRNHLGDPGGGFVPASHVIGTVAATYWRAG